MCCQLKLILSVSAIVTTSTRPKSDSFICYHILKDILLPIPQVHSPLTYTSLSGVDLLSALLR